MHLPFPRYHRQPLANTYYGPTEYRRVIVEMWSNLTGSLPGTEAKDCGAYIPIQIYISYMHTYIQTCIVYTNTLYTR